VDATIPSDVIRVGQIEIRFRLQAAQTGGNFTMFEYLIPVNARVPIAHSHEAFDETLYGLDGVTSVTLDGRNVVVGRGDVLFILRGSVHQVENLGVVDARGLSVITPGLLGPEFFREVADVLNVGGRPNIDRIAAVMRRHGLRPAQQAT
jgi:quercetin dioxygenase-like cupin family protein